MASFTKTWMFRRRKSSSTSCGKRDSDDRLPDKSDLPAHDSEDVDRLRRTAGRVRVLVAGRKACHGVRADAAGTEPRRTFWPAATHRRRPQISFQGTGASDSRK